MKILVLTGSPRRKGNSNYLADSFIKGAEEAGHNVVRFDSAFKKVNPCIACNKCHMAGSCIFDDDFKFVLDNLIDADAVVFVSPVYYFGITAQLKKVIDRFYAADEKIHTPKKAVMLITLGAPDKRTEEAVLQHFNTMFNYLNWQNAGYIFAGGLNKIGAAENTNYPELAYELGRNI